MLYCRQDRTGKRDGKGGQNMGELAGAMQLLNGRLSTAILECPSGRYTIVGSVPMSLCHHKGGAFPQWVANVYQTEQEVIDAILGAGIDRFQLSDCSWYGEGA